MIPFLRSAGIRRLGRGGAEAPRGLKPALHGPAASRALVWVGVFLVMGALAWTQTRSDIKLILKGGTVRKIALPDFRAAGGAAPLAAVFNQTVFDDIQRSGLLEPAAKSFYPLNPPQQESDLRATPEPRPARRGAAPETPNCGGLCLSDWANPPVEAAYLGFGYLAEQAGQLVAFGHLYTTSVPDVASAKAFRKLYNAPMTEEGARRLAHEYAADILKQFGGQSLAGSKIYFVSDRGGASGTKELWVMDFDGQDQRQLTKFNSVSTMPAVSPDHNRLAFTTFAKGQPQIMVMSLETFRYLPFMNPQASLNATPSFTPDGSRMLFSSTLDGRYTQIYVANADGTGVQRLSNSRAIEMEPKVNPKTGQDVLFVSGRGGGQHIYRMNLDGAGVERITDGTGEAANPAWHPDGQIIAFKWTRGFAPGNWNLFIMDVASRETAQLTHGAGRNENPSWAPDGRHLVFSSNRSGRYQIYSMLPDGTELRQLTHTGNNTMPVWVK
ncbi:MAG: PD40 domain-containing protein [Bryobacteraceae bacterium]|nr:PD40 domain-containing protein [Bryobacteraceae bacterium]